MLHKAFEYDTFLKVGKIDVPTFQLPKWLADLGWMLDCKPKVCGIHRQGHICLLRSVEDSINLENLDDKCLDIFFNNLDNVDRHKIEVVIIFQHYGYPSKIVIDTHRVNTEQDWEEKLSDLIRPFMLQWQQPAPPHHQTS